MTPKHDCLPGMVVWGMRYGALDDRQRHAALAQSGRRRRDQPTHNPLYGTVALTRLEQPPPVHKRLRLVNALHTALRPHIRISA